MTSSTPETLNEELEIDQNTTIFNINLSPSKNSKSMLRLDVKV